VVCESLAKQHGVVHWVIVPQYKEDVETVSMTLSSLRQNKHAKSTMGVVLAMEEREPQAKQKADQLCERFSHEFMEIIVTYHPANLPNDPPGKASNVSWAFATLLNYLWRSDRDMSMVVLTISDADSEFSSVYFEYLTAQYLSEDAVDRNRRMWQSPMMHMKNYYRQPAPVAVGTMFTTMQELSTLGDPNGVRLPYSTYSLSLELARQVGGWDSEWIAEDWHMGIKCYLMTLGQVQVVPIMVPTVNYTPEDSTYWKTIVARWNQAKRHALGFSDMSYFFMMIPLIFSYIVSSGRRPAWNEDMTLRSFWVMFCSSYKYVCRLVNVHVLIGTLTTFGAINFALRFVMLLGFSEDRHARLLFARTSYEYGLLTVVTAMFMLLVPFLFVNFHGHVKDSLEKETGTRSFVFRNGVVHWLYAASCFLVFGIFYFFGLGICVWMAAVRMITTQTFEYEVAAKPTAKNRL